MLRLVLRLLLDLLGLFVLSTLVALLLRLLLRVLGIGRSSIVAGAGAGHAILLVGLRLLRLGLLLRCSGGPWGRCREAQALRPLALGLHLGED